MLARLYTSRLRLYFSPRDSDPVRSPPIHLRVSAAFFLSNLELPTELNQHHITVVWATTDLPHA